MDISIVPQKLKIFLISPVDNKKKHVYYAFFKTDAGWSSLVARRAHNPKVVGSNPAPATI
jgi:hypothetical protein